MTRTDERHHLGSIETACSPARPTLRWCVDANRSLVALAAAIAMPAAAWLVVAALGLSTDGWADGRAFLIILILLGWNVFAVVYVVTTALTFSRVDAPAF